MTALPISTLPIDPTPPPSRAPDSAGGGHFFSLVQSAPAQSGAGAGAPAAPAAAAAPAQTSAVPATNGAGNRTSSQGDASQDSAQPQSKNANDNGSGTASAVVIPLPVPLVLAQPLPPGSAASGAATAAGNAGAPSSATAPAAGPTSANVVAQLMATTALNIAAAGTLTAAPSTAQPGAAQPTTPASAQATSAAKTFAALTATNPQPGNIAAQTGAPAPAPNSATAALVSAQPLPAVAGTMGLRIASSATLLVSQPSAALASVAPDAEKPTAAKPGEDPALALLGHAAAGADDGHAGKTPNASSETSFEQLIAGAAKASAAAGQSLARDPAEDGTAKSAAAADPANASTVAANPPAVPMTPVAAPADVLPALPMLAHSVSEQVAVSLRQAVKDGSDHIQIQLQPADLGAVQVKLSINHDGRVTMVVSADRSDTLNLLQQGAGGLTQALRDAGLQADSSSLSFNLRGGYQFNQQQSTGYAAAAGIDDLGSIDAIGAGPAPIPMLRAHSGSLDIQV